MALLEISKPIQERFRELRDDWKSKTRHLSNTAQISLVFPYQMIIGMGPQVVPLILAELEKETDHWFWALKAITGENPLVLLSVSVIFLDANQRGSRRNRPVFANR